MRGLERYVGRVLDGKYRLERLLGQGGMGAVYLATHLGTERFVALKLIAPEFMRNSEFVERFKREARAAGRLRHPNVVDVTDFGFATAGDDQMAYLVMEYLDGCTLGDILVEEKRLPVEWVIDILEQVCSAVHEAHLQGIVHRDLKPDNIWLEPNRIGGYRVKVLDFGIAKLAEADATAPKSIAPAPVDLQAPTLTPAHAAGNQPRIASDPESATLLVGSTAAVSYQSRAGNHSQSDLDQADDHHAAPELAVNEINDAATSAPNGEAAGVQSAAVAAAFEPIAPSSSSEAATETTEADATRLLPVAPIAIPVVAAHQGSDIEADGTRLFDPGTRQFTPGRTTAPNGPSNTENLT